MQPVTRQDVVDGVRRLGVCAGGLLVVHGSLSSFGRVAGGGVAVARALVEAVSPGGSVFVPTFTYGKAPFDPAASPSLDGAITEAFRRFPGAIRSLHPTHSLAGLGPAAAEVLAGHDRTTSFGPGSPLWRLWQRNAGVVLIGVDHRADSMIHVAEESLALPYLNRTRVAPVLRADGSVEERTVRRGGCSTAFNRIEGPLRDAERVRSVVVGASKVQLVHAADVVATAAELLRANPAALLCDRVGCEVCEEARRVIAASG